MDGGVPLLDGLNLPFGTKWDPSTWIRFSYCLGMLSPRDLDACCI